jgi:hypothetical protein
VLIRHSNYYNRSFTNWKDLMNKAIPFAVLALSILGCASGPPPRVFRVTDMKGMSELANGQPMIIEFHEGDTLPLDFSLQGPLLESAKDAPPIILTAKRRFFLRIDGDGFHSSLDGKDFSKNPNAPGTFQIGIGATRERGTRANITIKGPTPNEPK